MRVVLLLKPIILVIVACQISLKSHSFKSKELQIHERLGTLKASCSDTVYLHVLPGESFVIQAGLRRNKMGGAIEVQDMRGKVILSDPKFKNLRKELPADETNNAIRIILSNFDSIDAEVKFLVFRKTSTPEISLDHRVYWRTDFDTTYKIVDQPYLIRTDTSFIELVSDRIKVHSTLNLNGNEVSAAFRIPENTISWCVYVEVDQGQQSAYEKGANELAKWSSSASRLLTSSPLVPLMLSGISLIPKIQKGEEVRLSLSHGQGREWQCKEFGLIINSSRVMDDCTPREYQLNFENDNSITPVHVDYKVHLLRESKVYQSRMVEVIDEIKSERVWFVK